MKCCGNCANRQDFSHSDNYVRCFGNGDDVGFAFRGNYDDVDIDIIYKIDFCCKNYRSKTNGKNNHTIPQQRQADQYGSKHGEEGEETRENSGT